MDDCVPSTSCSHTLWPIYFLKFILCMSTVGMPSSSRRVKSEHSWKDWTPRLQDVFKYVFGQAYGCTPAQVTVTPWPKWEVFHERSQGNGARIHSSRLTSSILFPRAFWVCEKLQDKRKIAEHDNSLWQPVCEVSLTVDYTNMASVRQHSYLTRQSSSWT